VPTEENKFRGGPLAELLGGKKTTKNPVKYVRLWRGRGGREEGRPLGRRTNLLSNSPSGKEKIVGVSKKLYLRNSETHPTKTTNKDKARSWKGEKKFEPGLMVVVLSILMVARAQFHMDVLFFS